MTTAHALNVDTSARHSSPPMAGRRSNSPETPTPEIEQSAVLSFADALRCFQAQHNRPVDAKDGVREAALLIDMVGEQVYTKRAQAAVVKQYTTCAAIVFVEWALSLRRAPTIYAIETRFGVTRATAYRWRATWLAIKGVDAK